MIGNNKYIAHFMSQKEESPNKDAHEIEMIMNEYWRYIKYLMMYTHHTSILLPYLGTFNFQNRRGRKAARYFIKKLKKEKERKNLTDISEIEKIMHERNLKQLQSTLKQIDELRYLFLARNEKYKRKKNNKNNMSNKIDTEENN